MTKIEWATETWNPIIGCSKVSSGCDNCYAERMAKRLAKIPSTNYYENIVDETGWTGDTFVVNSQMNKPYKWKKKKIIFVCSMGDLFHETISSSVINAVFDVMLNNYQHTYLLLTKRPMRMLTWYEKHGYKKLMGALRNIWFGVTAENQSKLDLRVPILAKIPESKFVSIEPMLSEINLTSDKSDTFKLLSEIDWVICGGESGPGARPIKPHWVHNLRNQCAANNTAFFFKQWGGVNKKQTGCLINGVNVQGYPLNI